MSFFSTQNPGIGGLDELTDAEALLVQNLYALGDPNADRILFWDESANSYQYLQLGTNLSITGTTLNASGGAASVAGSDTQVQFNDGGSFGADAHFYYNKTTDVLHVHGLAGDATDGLLIESENGTDVGILGAANTANATWYGTHNFPATGLQIGSSNPFTDSSGTLTLQNVDVLDATTETTIENALDTLPNVTSIQGRTVTLADAGTNAIFGWDDTAGAYENLTASEATATLNAFVGDSGSGGTKGLVPAPSAGDSGKYLKGDGTWGTISAGGDVTKVGTPVDNQIGVWTGNGTIEGDADFTYNGTTNTLDFGSGGTIFSSTGSVTHATVSNIYGAASGNGTKGQISFSSETVNIISGQTQTTIGFSQYGTSNYAKLSMASLSTDRTFTFPDITGTFCINSTSQIHTVSSIELGHASDTSITRVSAGVAAIEGNNIITANITASDTQTGVIEIATAAETTTGTDATRAVSPDGLAGSEFGKRTVSILVSDPNGDAITIGDGKAVFPIDTTLNGMNLVAVKGYLSTVSSSGAPNVQIRRSRRSSATARTTADMLSTALTIDASEFESADAATAAVINTSNDDVQTGDMIFIDIDGAGTGAKGLQVLLTFQLP